MQEVKFKVLDDGDELFSFSDKRMIVKKKDGSYHVYKVHGFADGNPRFDKSFKVIITRGKGKIEIYDSESQITVLG